MVERRRFGGVSRGGAQCPDSSVSSAQTAWWEDRVIHLYFCVRMWEKKEVCDAFAVYKEIISHTFNESLAFFVFLKLGF